MVTTGEIILESTCTNPRGGGTHKSFIRGGSALRSKPLPFYIQYLVEKVPLSYTFHRKWNPFHIPTERLLPNFLLQKPLKAWMDQPLGASVRGILKLLIPI